ncbi:MAG: ubiquitin-conjugating enzyme E2 [Promethearchaeota archaeon]
MPELPYEIWKERIDNELNNVQKLNVLANDSIKRTDEFTELIFNVKALGFIMKDSELLPKDLHKIHLRLNRMFPYPGGVDFSWLTEIFHPNIDSVEKSFSSEHGTGYICLNILKQWSRLSDLVTIVKALEILVENPNPDDPLDYPYCLEAAKYFKKHKIEKLKKKFISESNDKEPKEEDEDDIVILD